MSLRLVLFASLAKLRDAVNVWTFELSDAVGSLMKAQATASTALTATTTTKATPQRGTSLVIKPTKWLQRACLNLLALSGGARSHHSTPRSLAGERINDAAYNPHIIYLL